MPGNFKKEDLRYLKTHKALMTAMSELLRLRSFTQITVNDLCEEAQIGRPTFYAHFNDKYDLLKQWLPNLEITEITDDGTYTEFENTINNFVDNNKNVIKNLTENANNETSQLLCHFIFSLLNINIDRTDNGQVNQKYIFLLRFYSGGIMNYLLWHIENKFPTDFPVMNPYFYQILINVQKWKTELK